MSEKSLRPVVSCDQVRFDASGLIPAIIQQADTGQVLMLGYMNSESLQKTLATGYTWFFSRSRNQLWKKGETSGHVQKVRSVMVDCDQDALLVQVDQVGPGACHKGFRSCFHNQLEGAPSSSIGVDSDEGRTFDPDQVYSDANSRVIDELYQVIASRKESPQEGSYTSYLFREGLDKILKKVGEESAEVLISGKGGDEEGLVAESADLIYHLLVLWVESGVKPQQIFAELAKRRGGGGSEDAPPGK